MIILGTNSIKDTGFNVANSLRLGGSNESLSFSESTTPTGKTKFTLSTWLKRSKLGSDQVIMFNAKDGSNFAQIYFRGSQKDIRYFDRVGGGDTCVGTTDMFFNDVSAFYHIVLRVDTTLGTAGDRVRIYVNGNEVAFTFDNTPSQDQALTLNNTGTKYIGVDSSGGNYFGGYHSEFCWIDGSSLAPDQFGEFDEDSGIWKPIDVSGLTFGNNGFYLNFETAAELGTDVSGNSNTFTESNLTAVDQSTDTCTNNFATLNPLNNYWSAATFSEGNSVYTSNNTNAYYGVAQSTIGVSKGRWYFEAKNSTDSSGQGILGITSRNQTGRGTWLGSTSQAYGYYASGGVIRSSASDTSYGATYTVNDIIGIYLDLDNNKMYVSDNGALQNSGTGHTITAAASTDSGFYHFAVGDNSDNTQVWQCNFGGTSGFTVSSGNTDDNGYGNFEYSPNITGDGVAKKFYALCTKNLAEYG